MFYFTWSSRSGGIIRIQWHDNKGFILDPTVRFEQDTTQALKVDQEKKLIYEPCIPYLSTKYQIPSNRWTVIVLLFGSRGAIPSFTWNILEQLKITTSWLQGNVINII